LADFAFLICGLDELDQFHDSSVTHVVSILDPAWPVPDIFAEFPDHDRLELRFHDIIDEAPGTGYDAPQLHHVEQVLAFGRQLTAAGRGHRVLVHCHAGISRSTAALLLILAQAEPERPADDIIADIVGIRSKTWPNLRMIEIGDRLLGRDGALVAAVRRRHRTVLETQPHIADLMRSFGRHRELDHAGWSEISS